MTHKTQIYAIRHLVAQKFSHYDFHRKMTIFLAEVI
jgi:hypothetical protein